MAKKVRRVLGAMLGCCLLAVVSGCLLSRQETGPRYRPSDVSEDGRSPSAAIAADHVGKPELLPWRSRIRDRLLNSRLVHGRKDPSAQPPAEETPVERPQVSPVVSDDLPAPASARAARPNRPDYIAY